MNKQRATRQKRVTGFVAVLLLESTWSRARFGSGLIYVCSAQDWSPAGTENDRRPSRRHVRRRCKFVRSD